MLRRWCVLAFLGMFFVASSGFTSQAVASVDTTKRATATGQSVGKLVREVDTTFGYSILRPEQWESINLGDSRGYMPAGSASEADRVLMLVTNLETLSTLIHNNASQSNGTVQTSIMPLAQFRANPSLSAWMQARERSWQAQGLPAQRLKSLPNASIYIVRPAADQLHVISYAVVDKQPLMVTLYGYGAFSDLQRLIDSGLLADFETMVASVAPAKPVPVPSEQSDTSAMPLRVDHSYSTGIGSYHCHGSVCGYDFSVTLIGGWDSGIHRVERMYESLWYRHSDLRSQWLYRSSVGDDNYTACAYGYGYIDRSIYKQTTPAIYQVSDDYYPFYTNTNIGSQTYHTMNYGDGAVSYCTDHKPFY